MQILDIFVAEKSLSLSKAYQSLLHWIQENQITHFSYWFSPLFCQRPFQQHFSIEQFDEQKLHYYPVPVFLQDKSIHLQLSWDREAIPCFSIQEKQKKILYIPAKICSVDIGYLDQEMHLEQMLDKTKELIMQHKDSLQVICKQKFSFEKLLAFEEQFLEEVLKFTQNFGIFLSHKKEEDAQTLHFIFMHANINLALTLCEITIYWMHKISKLYHLNGIYDFSLEFSIETKNPLKSLLYSASFTHALAEHHALLQLGSLITASEIISGHRDILIDIHCEKEKIPFSCEVILQKGKRDFSHVINTRFLVTALFAAFSDSLSLLSSEVAIEMNKEHFTHVREILTQYFYQTTTEIQLKQKEGFSNIKIFQEMSSPKTQRAFASIFSKTQLEARKEDCFSYYVEQMMHAISQIKDQMGREDIKKLEHLQGQCLHLGKEIQAKALFELGLPKIRKVVQK